MQLIDVRAVASMLGCSQRHVFNLAKQGAIPSPLRLGRCVRWNQAVIEEWIAKASLNEAASVTNPPQRAA